MRNVTTAWDEIGEILQAKRIPSWPAPHLRSEDWDIQMRCTPEQASEWRDSFEADEPFRYSIDLRSGERLFVTAWVYSISIDSTYVGEGHILVAVTLRSTGRPRRYKPRRK